NVHPMPSSHHAEPVQAPHSSRPDSVAPSERERAPYQSAHPARGSLHPSDAPARPSLPLLIDVTPRSLTVETVGGFCDVLVARNTKVPCEESRTFVTARDGQQAVHVRVGQGESTRFFDNTLLGELELSGLRPAPRGKIQV